MKKSKASMKEETKDDTTDVISNIFGPITVLRTCSPSACTIIIIFLSHTVEYVLYAHDVL